MEPLTGFASFLSGNVFVDGLTMFVTIIALWLLLVRVLFHIHYRLFDRRYGTLEHFDHESRPRRVVRWTSFLLALFLWSVQFAYWARLAAGK